MNYEKTISEYINTKEGKLNLAKAMIQPLRTILDYYRHYYICY